ncbi:MAG: hypothetical protein OXG79_09195 [Chloroflexi bacterium]|nr:hypothetical protein [Chloroflexota bacterium]
MNTRRYVSRGLLMLAAVVIAGALSVTAAVEMLQLRRQQAPLDASGTGMTAAYVTMLDRARTDARHVFDVPVSPEVSVWAYGWGASSADPIELTSGLWIVDVRFNDYTPPTHGPLPGVTVHAVGCCGGMGWTGTAWAAIHVGDWQHPELVTFTPGAVIVEVHAIPADVMWWVTFKRLGDLKPS